MMMTPTIQEAYELTFEKISGKKPVEAPEVYKKFLRYSAQLTVKEARDIIARYKQ